MGIFGPSLFYMIMSLISSVSKKKSDLVFASLVKTVSRSVACKCYYIRFKHS